MNVSNPHVVHLKCTHCYMPMYSKNKQTKTVQWLLSICRIKANALSPAWDSGSPPAPTPATSGVGLPIHSSPVSFHWCKGVSLSISWNWFWSLYFHHSLAFQYVFSTKLVHADLLPELISSNCLLQFGRKPVNNHVSQDLTFATFWFCKSSPLSSPGAHLPFLYILKPPEEEEHISSWKNLQCSGRKGASNWSKCNVWGHWVCTVFWSIQQKDTVALCHYLHS